MAAEKILDDAKMGIAKWRPVEFATSPDDRVRQLSQFFSSWSGVKRDVCPRLPAYVSRLIKDCVDSLEIVRHAEPFNKDTLLLNLTGEEKETLLTLKTYGTQIGFNLTDKNFGPALYSRTDFLKQCQLHLDSPDGTYIKVPMSRKEVLEGSLWRLRKLLNRHRDYHGGPLSRLCNTFLRFAEKSVAEGILNKFYIIWKLHKAAKANGLYSRPIASGIGFFTEQMSHYLDSQLKDAVFRHDYVLKDSTQLARILNKLRIVQDEPVFIAAADVCALYPSIPLQDGLKALRWFLDEYMPELHNKAKHLYVAIAQFILQSNFIECVGIDDAIYLQQIGTAMGTSFSVVYAIIFMLWLEQPIVTKFQRFIALYKRFIDDLILIWNGPFDQLKAFVQEYNARHPAIKLEWQGRLDELQSADLRMVRRGTCMDLSVSVKQVGDAYTFPFHVHRKMGSSYGYLPYKSFHQRHVHPGWIKAELIRLLTHSSTEEAWTQERAFFKGKLRARGYPIQFLNRAFHQVSWADRQTHLCRRGRKRGGDTFFQQYMGCVMTLPNTPWIRSLRRRLELDLDIGDLNEPGHDSIFPRRAFIAYSNCRPLGALLKR
jgi:hypothetical protein